MSVTTRVVEKEERVIDARGIKYKVLNAMVEEALKQGVKRIKLLNVNGQRYIAAGVKGRVEIEIHGTPGDDLGAFMDGPLITVYGNAQDGIGNTMNSGMIIVHGDARDIVGHSMRGGKIFVNGDVGYRVGIHMKEYKGNYPVIVAAGVAGDFLGEYMAGGRVVILGINRGDEDIVGDWIATGIHGGALYVRGDVPESRLGVAARIVEMDEEDRVFLRTILKEFSEVFGHDYEKLLKGKFTKIAPLTHRPFGKMYTD
jgi:glutamate synthase domain-containing protein 3